MEKFILFIGDLLNSSVNKFDKVDIRNMQNDHEHYQRLLIPSKVLEHKKQLEANPNLDWIGLVATRYEHGPKQYIINGQHHVAAARQLNIQYLPFYSFVSQGWETERIIFNLFQKFQSGDLKL